MGERNAPVESRSEAPQRGGEARSTPNFDFIKEMKSAPDRPAGPASKEKEPESITMTGMSWGHFADPEKAKTATDLKGNKCEAQPKDGETPVLKPGEKSPGCEYTSAEKDPLTAKTVEEQKDKVVNISSLNKDNPSDGNKGTGTMVSKTADTCTVLTDAHVIENAGGDPYSKALSASTASGENFPAKLAGIDPKNDLALVTMQTGARTDAVCKPAAVSTSDALPAAGQKLTSLGYPLQSDSMYASPGEVKETTSVGQLYDDVKKRRPSDTSKPMPGEDTSRPAVLQTGQLYQGMSGGPAFNDKGELAGVTSRSYDQGSVTTPVNTETIARIPRK